MKTKGTVLFVQGWDGKWKASLWLKHVRRNPDNSIKSGWVINGCWSYLRTDTEEWAKQDASDTEPVNRWPIQPYREVPVMADWDECKIRRDDYGYGVYDDYNAVMGKAQEVFDSDMFYPYAPEIADEFEERQKQLREELDDDIPF